MAKKHAALGGSSCPRWVPCPGSIHLCADIPPTTNDYADGGTAAHTLGEEALRDCKAVSSYLKKKYKVNGKPWKVTEEMVFAVQQYVEAVRLEKKGRELYIEKKFDLTKLDTRFAGLEMFGTNDACVSELFGKLTIYDYKHGQGVSVEVKRNYQLMFYALGAYLSLQDDNDVIELVVVQPRKEHVDGPIRRWQLTPEELLDWGYNTLLPAAKATQKPDAPLNPGYWCNKYFCPAQATCPALHEKAIVFARQDFVTLDAPERMSTTQISEALRLQDLLSPFFNKVHSHAKAEMQRGVVIPGYKLVEGRAGNRQWINEKLVADLVINYGEKVIYEPRKLLSVAQMDKLVKATNKKQGKKKNKPEDLYGHLITRSPPGVSIAPESSPKPALLPSVQTDFDPIVDDDEFNDIFG